MSAFESLLAVKLENPEVRAAFEDSRDRHELVRLLVEVRVRRRVTQKQIADLMGVTQSTVSGFETEDADPRLSTLQRYARALNHKIVVDVRPCDYSAWVGKVQSQGTQRPTFGRQAYATASQARLSSSGRGDFGLAA